MNLVEFKDSLKNHVPPTGLSNALQALWYDANDADMGWERAHEQIQADTDSDESWVHAYLHRKEGDLPNASYWYARAKKPVSKVSLEAEWDEITEALLMK